MKAIAQNRYGSTDVLALQDIPVPTPKDGEVLLRVRAAGVDPGVWHLMTGQPYLLRLMGFGLRRPKVAVRGRDVAGVVEAVGSGVTGFQPGDAVFGTAEGSFAEYVCARADRLAAKPANLTFEQAAAMPISAGSALQGLRDAGRIRAGQHVLITGAGGGVGSFAVQLAKEFCAQVTAVCGPERVELVRSLGADRVIDRSQADFIDGTRYDLILDNSGLCSLAHLRRALTPAGTLVIVGGEGAGRWFGGIDRVLRALLWSLVLKQNLRGLFATERAADFALLGELAEEGKLTPALDRTFPLSETAAAIKHLHDGKARGKVVISV
ncbi:MULTISPECIES: NAD(P)-dependent alcohol dehydrogenase [unclassified Crossiella]|uniref:NAD(P)-dependent alcohol dehydrogenase n=1 Tax=unclassified Crossiella TaxID=2620835 RepID=UPI001FFE3E1E|nr:MULTISPECIES: NAD(P)-dependent alcohol dehydrogenase [unclassified Crossiella]MCK2238059.1 NAD(P)-dependent alcohol dehydrogenase [Crossiella sp. S99.2]MCK2256127.1 NAD(P)-dependent alcohol dehydrogenase [Crossiella sp. S99.1]